MSSQAVFKRQEALLPVEDNGDEHGGESR